MRKGFWKDRKGKERRYEEKEEKEREYGKEEVGLALKGKGRDSRSGERKEERQWKWIKRKEEEVT